MTSRLALLLITGISSAAVALSFFTDNYLGWHPCYLCITQRALFSLSAVLGFVGLTLGNRFPRIMHVLVGLTASAGAAVAASQLYVQANADKMSCGGGNPNLLEVAVNWLGENVGSFFLVTGFCTDPYPILGVPMAGWSALLFSAFCGLAVVGFRRK